LLGEDVDMKKAIQEMHIFCIKMHVYKIHMQAVKGKITFCGSVEGVKVAGVHILALIFL
jgi:hypothetical protein